MNGTLLVIGTSQRVVFAYNVLGETGSQCSRGHDTSADFNITFVACRQVSILVHTMLFSLAILTI